MIQLYGTIQISGRAFASCYYLMPNGSRRDFQISERTHGEVVEIMRKLQAEINAAHPRRGESGAKTD